MTIITDKGIVNLVNLTPHQVNYIERGEVKLSISGCNNPPRVEEQINGQEHLEVEGRYNIKIHNAKNVFVKNLPEEQENTYYIVSRIIAEYSDREDLLVPHEFIKNPEGEIIGCKSFKKVM